MRHPFCILLQSFFIFVSGDLEKLVFINYFVVFHSMFENCVAVGFSLDRFQVAIFDGDELRFASCRHDVHHAAVIWAAHPSGHHDLCTVRDPETKPFGGVSVDDEHDLPVTAKCKDVTVPAQEIVQISVPAQI